MFIYFVFIFDKCTGTIVVIAIFLGATTSVPHLMFVDDFSKCCKSSNESKKMGEAVTKALTELKMEAHPDKSGILVFGKQREKWYKDLDNNPTYIQNFTMKPKSLETYLGMQFSEGGSSDSITKTLLSRRIKCMTKSISLRNNLQDIRVQSVGWLATAVTVFKAVIVSTLVYGSGAWLNMTKGQEELVESIQRSCLIQISPIASSSSRVSVAPVGLCGVFSSSTLLCGVTQRSRSAA